MIQVVEKTHQSLGIADFPVLLFNFLDGGRVSLSSEGCNGDDGFVGNDDA